MAMLVASGEAMYEVKAKAKLPWHLSGHPRHSSVPLPSRLTHKIFHLLGQLNLRVVPRTLHSKLMPLLAQLHLKLVPRPLQVRPSSTILTQTLVKTSINAPVLALIGVILLKCGKCKRIVIMQT